MPCHLACLTGAALIDFVAREPKNVSKPWIDIFAYDAETETAVGRNGETRQFSRADVSSVHAVRISGSVLDITRHGVTVSRDRWRNEHILELCGVITPAHACKFRDLHDGAQNEAPGFP